MNDNLKKLDWIKRPWQLTRRLFGKKELRASTSTNSLVKSAPDRLSLQYRIMTDPGKIDALFLRLRQDFYAAAERQRPGRQGSPAVLREAGKLSPGRPYFYLKPLNQAGWLFERSGQGWVISRAEKIVSQETFVRDPETWDQVILHEAESGTGLPRVSSPRLGAEMVSFGIYQEMLFNSLGFGPLTNSRSGIV